MAPNKGKAVRRDGGAYEEGGRTAYMGNRAAGSQFRNHNGEHISQAGAAPYGRRGDQVVNNTEEGGTSMHTLTQMTADLNVDSAFENYSFDNGGRGRDRGPGRTPQVDNSNGGFKYGRSNDQGHQRTFGGSGRPPPYDSQRQPQQSHQNHNQWAGGGSSNAGGNNAGGRPSGSSSSRPRYEVARMSDDGRGRHRNKQGKRSQGKPEHYSTIEPAPPWANSGQRSFRPSEPPQATAHPIQFYPQPQFSHYGSSNYGTNNTGSSSRWPDNRQGHYRNILEDDDGLGQMAENFSSPVHRRSQPPEHAYATEPRIDPHLNISPTYRHHPHASAQDPQFANHSSSDFFLGRVLKCEYPEMMGRNASDRSNALVSKAGNDFFAKDRRFIIVAAGHGHSTCLAIVSYGKQGCAKNGADPVDHGIVYTTDMPPPPLEGEGILGFKPIKMLTDSGGLHHSSRVNYSKHFNVEHNAGRVQFVGCIAKEHLGELLRAMNEAFQKGQANTPMQ